MSFLNFLQICKTKTSFYIFYYFSLQPFIYCWLNESFRKGAIKMLSFACICCSKTIGNGDIDPDTDGLEITTTGNTTLMTSVNNNCKRQSVVLDNNNGDNGNCQFKRIAEQQLSTAETEVNCSSPANERHEENCPKTMKAATNCQKEKRKFRKLRLSSFRKNAAHHHHHHHHHNYNHNHNHNHNQQTQHHCNCKSILSNSVIEKNGCCLESANGSANAPSSTKHGTVVQTGDMRAEMISSGGTTTLTTARATCLASKTATTSCSLESVASSHNSSNGSSSSGRSGSNSCAGQQSSSGSSCSASAGAFNAGKPTAGVTVCNHNGNGCSSLEENAAAAVAAVSSGCIQVNVSLSVQPCDTVATTASSTLNKSTFV